MSTFHVQRLVSEYPWIAKVLKGIRNFEDAKVGRLDESVLQETNFSNPDYGFYRDYYLVDAHGKFLNKVASKRFKGLLRLFALILDLFTLDESVYSCAVRTMKECPDCEITYVLCVENGEVVTLYKLPHEHTMKSYMDSWMNSAKEAANKDFEEMNK